MLGKSCLLTVPPTGGSPGKTLVVEHLKELRLSSRPSALWAAAGVGSPIISTPPPSHVTLNTGPLCQTTMLLNCHPPTTASTPRFMSLPKRRPLPIGSSPTSENVKRCLTSVSALPRSRLNRNGSSGPQSRALAPLLQMPPGESSMAWAHVYEANIDNPLTNRFSSFVCS